MIYALINVLLTVLLIIIWRHNMSTSKDALLAGITAANEKLDELAAAIDTLKTENAKAEAANIATIGDLTAQVNDLTAQVELLNDEKIPVEDINNAMQGVIDKAKSIIDSVKPTGETPATV